MEERVELELLRNARKAGEAARIAALALGSEQIAQKDRTSLLRSLPFIFPSMAVLVGLGIMAYNRGEPSSPTLSPVEAEVGCENLDGPPSKILSIRLKNLSKNPDPKVLTIFYVSNLGVYSRPSTIYRETDGFYVELIGSNGKGVGRNGPRPGGQISIISSRYQGTVEVHSGSVSQLNARESQPISKLAVDSDACK